MLWLFLVGMLLGCVNVRVSPALLLPPTPALHFEVCQDTKVCLSEADGNKLLKYFEALDAYRLSLQALTP